MESLRSNQALSRMRAGEVEHLYVLANHATPRDVDFVFGNGLFQSLWVDLEHFDIPTQDLPVLKLAAHADSITTIARFKAADCQSVVRGIEKGVTGSCAR